ncbi:MarC family protein [Pararhizobium haloflavum]|uniref:MarC family protein n=1 Tax=Pararhizobium haloflavum TaxID=2037914 RepID=UPI000C19CA52|nr:MarC family protein [Pararhizobium haloflavum]
MHLELLVNALVTILVTIDPPGLAPIFLGLTPGMSRAQRIQVAFRACLISGTILIVFALAGSAILSLFGITLGAFRIAGGMLLFWIAFEMIFEKRQERHEKSAERAVTADHISNIAVFPLAIPLVAGPGAISAIILLSGSFAAPLARMELVGVIVFCIAILFAALVIADRLDRFLGETGRMILTRLLGVILAALAVQFVVDGIASLEI